MAARLFHQGPHRRQQVLWTGRATGGGQNRVGANTTVTVNSKTTVVKELMFDYYHKTLPKSFEHYIPTNNLATNTRITRQHNQIRTGKPRTHFSSKLPLHHFTKQWNNLDYKLQNLKSRHKFKSVISKHYLSSYLNHVHCLNPRCVECN